MIDGTGGPALQMPAGGSRHAGVARDRGPAAALREAGRPGRVQVRGARRPGDRAAHARAQRPDGRTISICSSRTRPTAASSKPPPSGSASARDKVVINLETYGNTTAAHDSARARRRARGRPTEEGRSRAAGVGRRRVHGRVGAAALEPLDGVRQVDQTTCDRTSADVNRERRACDVTHADSRGVPSMPVTAELRRVDKQLPTGRRRPASAVSNGHLDRRRGAGSTIRQRVCR